MGLRLTVWGVGALVAAGFAGVLAMGTRASRAVDHASNFTEVQARVERVESLCRVYGNTGHVTEAIDADRTWAGGTWGDCDEARAYALAKNVSAFQGSNYVKARQAQVATVRYVSPADRQEHASRVEISPAASQQTFSPGAAVTVLAHDKDPLKLDLS